MKKILISIFLLISGLCFAQFSDEQMYHAYLNENMSLWAQYLQQTCFDTLSVAEQKRYLNYEFGYVANAVSNKYPGADKSLALFNQHINAMSARIAPSTLYAYRAAYAAYRAQYNSRELMTQGLRAIYYARQAVNTDSNDPQALLIAGCVYLYAPGFCGGGRNVANQYFTRATDVMKANGDTINNWNFELPTLLLKQK